MKHLDDHEALDKVLWTYAPPSCETAEYRGHKLRVRHLFKGPRPVLDDDKIPEYYMSIGYIDEKIAGHADNMPKICNILYCKVDELEAVLV